MNTTPLYFGDLHNHCNISYAHGSLEDALANARERLDFCSVTGHAHWCDMPEPNERIAHIVDFHVKGFAKLKAGWADVLETMQAANREGEFITFPGFEVHSSADGDRAIFYRDGAGAILYPDTIGDLHEAVRELNEKGTPAIALPHHIGYRRGARGINWDTFDEQASPIVEVYSMHGASEHTEGPVPYRHSMGPADSRSTVQYGLEAGHVFGFSANTDHHSAHPGSYGQGCTGVWADSLSREAIWEALRNRRTFALTGDRMRVDFELDGAPMGSVVRPGKARGLSATVIGGAAIDYVDVLSGSRLVKRISPDRDSQARLDPDYHSDYVRGPLYLEVGWGPRGVRRPWDVEVSISDGTIHSFEPRFRGPDVLSPVQSDHASGESTSHYSSSRQLDARSVHFQTVTYGNATNTTAGTQGVCLHIEAPRSTTVRMRLNGGEVEVPVARLLEGGLVGHQIDEIDAPAWLLHRIPQPEEWAWRIELSDLDVDLRPGAPVYMRVRQQNGQWAWASPVFARQ